MVLNRRQVPLLTDIVKDVDPDAFMIIMDVYDVLGYGFKSRSLNLVSDFNCIAYSLLTHC